ncbi:acyl carrier protein [Streptomyces niveus]|uniref:acyl carrier protein n=1 Tax=Streptomyces niveus TaxID=193462 RepID=UPI0036D40347
MSIEESIMRILVDDLFICVPQAQIGLDDGLRDVLGLDSLGFVELRAQCEYTFGVTVPEEEFVPDNFSSVRTLARLVTRLRESLLDEVGGQ